MNLQTSQPDKTRIIALSVLSGAGITILSLVIGIVVDYLVVQVVSQYFPFDCSENCYFAYFNAIFLIVALLSLAVGLAGGKRTYRQLIERSN